MNKTVWRVTGWNINYPGDTLFEAYYSDRDKANAVYHRGESEYGFVAGYAGMRWTLEGFDLDNDSHIDDMFNDVREAMEE